MEIVQVPALNFYSESEGSEMLSSNVFTQFEPLRRYSASSSPPFTSLLLFIFSIILSARLKMLSVYHVPSFFPIG
jgi:hypothetical protein